MLHNNSHFISLDYFENSLGLHYFSPFVCGCETGNSHIIIYLKKMLFRLLDWLLFTLKTETVVRLCAYALMILFTNPEDFQFVHASDRGLGMYTNKLKCLSGRHNDSYQCCSSTLFSPVIPMKMTG